MPKLRAELSASYTDKSGRRPGNRILQQPTKWQDQAACIDHYELNWIVEETAPKKGDPKKGEKTHCKTLAKEFCADCPVRLECLQYAINTKSEGVWGGHHLSWHPRRRVVNLLG